MIDDLAIFICVAKLGGFVNAARALHVSHTTISRRIKNLEDSLNMLLFNKNPHHFKLTEKGQHIYDLVVSQIEQNEELIHKIKNSNSFKKEPEGDLTIMLPAMISMYIITPKVLEFTLKYPKIRLNFLYGSSKNLSLLANNADIAIIPNLPKQQTQKIKKLFSDEVIFVCTEQYAKEYGIPQSPLDLNHHLCAFTTLPDEVYYNTKEFYFTNRFTGEVTKVEIAPRIMSDNLLQAIQYLYSNKVIVPIIPTIAAMLPGNLKLVKVLPEWNTFSITYYLLKNSFSDIIKLNLFSEFLISIISDAHMNGKAWLDESVQI